MPILQWLDRDKHVKAAEVHGGAGILVSGRHGLRLPAACNKSGNCAMLHVVGAVALRAI